MSTELNKREEKILEEDLSYLKDMVVHVSNGKRYLGTQNKAYNVMWTLTESEFVRDWLIQFALGNDNGINYFNANTWLDKTNKGQGLVEIVADDDPKRIILIIPPIAAVNLTSQDYMVLRKAISLLNQNAADTRKIIADMNNRKVANQVSALLSKEKTTITELIPEYFYEKHGIVPIVEKRCFYIRDQINGEEFGKTTEELAALYRCREILYRHHRKEAISSDDKMFVSKLSKNLFDWGDEEGQGDVPVNALADHMEDDGLEEM